MEVPYFSWTSKYIAKTKSQLKSFWIHFLKIFWLDPVLLTNDLRGPFYSVCRPFVAPTGLALWFSFQNFCLKLSQTFIGNHATFQFDQRMSSNFAHVHVGERLFLEFLKEDLFYFFSEIIFRKFLLLLYSFYVCYSTGFVQCNFV